MKRKNYVINLNAEQKQAIELAKSVILVAQKFDAKVVSGKAKSVETHTDLLLLMGEAKLLLETYQIK